MPSAGRRETSVGRRLVGQALAVGLAAAGPGSAEASGSEEEKLRRHVFVLGGARFEIALPDRGDITVRQDGDRVTIGASTRLARGITIRAVASAASQAGEHEILANRARLVYRIDRNTSRESAGSGGQEGELVGFMTVSGRVLEVECRDQREWPEPRPEWCLPYLGTLKLLPPYR